MDLIEELLALAGVPLDETERLDEMKAINVGREIYKGVEPSLKDVVSDLIVFVENGATSQLYIKTKAKILVSINGKRVLQNICVLTGKYDKRLYGGERKVGYSVRHFLAHLSDAIEDSDRNYRDDEPSKSTKNELLGALEVIENKLSDMANSGNPIRLNRKRRNAIYDDDFLVNGKLFRISLGIATKDDELTFLITIFNKKAGN